jgi:hypothetical protein
MRRGIDALLMATLVKPVAHRMVARSRRRARESAAASISVPVQELFEVALLGELASPPTELRTPAEDPEQPPWRGKRRTLLIVAAAIAAMSVGAVITKAAVRRRRDARMAQATDADWVAVPVDESTERTEEAAPKGAATR